MATNNDDDIHTEEEDEYIDLTEGDSDKIKPTSASLPHITKINSTENKFDRSNTNLSHHFRLISKSDTTKTFPFQQNNTFDKTKSNQTTPRDIHSHNESKTLNESKLGNTNCQNVKDFIPPNLQITSKKFQTSDPNPYKSDYQTDGNISNEKKSKHPVLVVLGPKRKMTKYETMENLGSSHKTNENLTSSAHNNNTSTTIYKNQQISESLPKRQHQQNVPLAEKYRPKTLGDFLGHEELMGENGLMRKLIETDQIPSFILWGPPGCGKTSIAEVISKLTRRKFFKQSAASCGLAEIRKVINEVMSIRTSSPRPILFLDEIHRFNKSQQDYLLPFVEKGTIILMGATTQNP